MSDDIDVTKLKVPELRAELSKRGLNTFGTRQVLVDRLCEAIGAAVPSAAPKTTSAMDSDEPPCITSPVSLKSAKQETSDQFSTRENGDVENDNTDDNKVDEAHSNVDVDIKTDHVQKNDGSHRNESEHKRKRSPSTSPRRDSRDRDSRQSIRRKSSSPSTKAKMTEEVDGWEKRTSVFLDSYNCDLSLTIDADGFHGTPQTHGGFSMMWAGVRANYGLISGKSFFEVRDEKHITVENMDSMSGGATHVLRVGWSTENTDFALGEEGQSFGYGGTGKKSTENKFLNYGCTFGEGDVVGAFLEWKPTEAILRFSVNGVDQGECYRVPKSTLGNKCALFPHIFVKNVEFSVNFGQDGQSPWFPPNITGDDSASWSLMNNVNISTRVHGRMPPVSKSDCEIFMLMGLPGAGKTYYGEHLRSENREKQYNVLGTNLILDKMKVTGLARQRNYHGRWDVLIDKATKCLNFLINIASMRRRNYILDQTNVYPSAQRRKMRPFEGFKRKAIVIVPTDEEFRRRIAQREKEEGKEVPESAVLEMKANFVIPKPMSEDPESVFDEVVFTELDSDAARDLVQTYNREGQANRPPPEKRQRWEGGRDRDSSDSRSRGGYDNRDRGRDFNRGRDDFHRSPNRRDDRGRRDYRGGYNAERDRSRDSDRFDRSRDRDSYGRSPSDRFGGRFGGPPGRGGFPPAPGGGYGGPQRGSGMMGRGGRGGPNMGRGYSGPGFDAGGAPPMNYRGSSDGRPPRGSRGGYGMQDRGPSGYSGPPSRFDNADKKGDTSEIYGMPPNARALPGSDVSMPPEGSATSGGYRGGYGSAMSRGGYGSGPDSSGFSGRGGRGAAPPNRDSGTTGRDGAMRGGSYGRGGPGGRGGFSTGGRGGYSNEQESMGYSAAGGERSQPPFNPYSQSRSEVPEMDASTYPSGANYPERGRSRFSSAAPSAYTENPSQPPKSGGYPAPSSGYPGSYQRGYPASGQPGYPGGGGYPNDASSGYPPSDYPGPDAYPSEIGGDRSRQQASRALSGPPPGASRFSSNESGKLPSGPQNDGQPMDGGSLYASGTARYSDGRAGASQQGTVPKQSRFDSTPPAAQQSYSMYSSGGYQGGYGTGYSGGQSAANPPPPQTGPQSSGTSIQRSSRSRFDVGPGSSQQSMPGTGGSQVPQTQQSAPQQVQPQPSQTSTQPYGYSYPPQGGAKTNPTSGQTATGQSAYSSYGYGGYAGYGAYGNQTASTQGANKAHPQSAAQSLYASAVAEKPQATAQPTQPAVQSSAAPDAAAAAAAAAYASYYGYGAQTAGAGGTTMPNQTSASMSAAQQFNAWQQPTTNAVTTTAATTPSVTTASQSATAAYANYYAGYPGYPTTYGTPTAGATSAAPNAQTMPQYYGGYR